MKIPPGRQVLLYAGFRIRIFIFEDTGVGTPAGRKEFGVIAVSNTGILSFIMEKVIEKSWNYILIKNNGNYYLSVLCGGIGLYELEINLNEQEVASFTNIGESYIDDLAKEIQKNTTKWLHRSIREDS